MARKTNLAVALAFGLLLAASGVHAGYAPGCTVRLDLGVGPVHEARAVAFQPDGRIVVAGYVNLGADRDFLVARFHPDLSLDTSFAGTGWVAVNFVKQDEAFGVAVQTDGKIVAVGYAENNGASKRFLAIMRLLPDGSFDSTFAGGGSIIRDVAGGSSLNEELRAVALQPDGKIVVAGYHSVGAVPGILVGRFLKDGNWDTSFDGDGLAQPFIGNTASASDVAIAPDENIVVSATATFAGDSDFVALRFRPDGSLDPAFNAGTGWRAANIGSFDDDASAVALQPDGKIVVAGTSSGDIALARYTSVGDLDLSFDVDGTTIHNIGTDAGNAVALDASGNIVVAGEGGAPDFALARFNTSGGNTLSVSDDILNDDRAFALRIRKDGKLLLAGTSQAPGNPQMTLSLFNPDGTKNCGSDGLHPTANAAISFIAVGACATNWRCANDEPGDAPTGGPAAHDASGTHLSSTAATNRELYLLMDGTLPPGKVVTEIEVVAQLAWGGPGAPPSVELLYQRQGFDTGPVRGATLSVSSTIFQPFRQRWTDLNWTSAELNALEIGLEHIGGDNLELTQIYVIVTYGEPLVQPVEPFTAASTGDGAGGQVTLNWLNPASGLYDETVIRRDTLGCPATPTAGTPVVNQADGLGTAGAFVDLAPIGPTYYYTAFVEDIENHASVGRCVVATPFDRTAVKVDWVYSTSDPSVALATPGFRISTNVVYSATNDGVVHAMTGGDGGLGGGSWPAGWKPYRLGAKAPNRPPVVQLPGVWAALFGAEDGHVYAVNAATGELVWRSPRLGMMISSSPAAILMAFGGAKDLVFIGTRDAGQPNRLYALNAGDGTVAWYFDNGGIPSDIGIITTGPSVSYTDQRIYFTSFAGGSGKTVWCLDFTSGAPVKCGSWIDFGVSTSSFGNVDASSILFSGLLYVSDQSPGENLYAFDPNSGAEFLVGFLGFGGARDYVFPRLGTTDVLASNANELVSFETTGPSINWTCAIPSPSAPLQVIGTNDVYAGGGDGKLHRLSAVAPGCPGTSECIGNCSTTMVGSPAYDFTKSMIYLGTDEGNFYGVKTPF